MCRTDNYILRITNTTLADGSLTISSDYSTVSFDTPDYLRKKGKCKITVVDGNICMVDRTTRLNLNSTKTIFLLQSNIPQLGYYTETRGAPTVLGTAPTIYTGEPDTGYNAPFEGVTPLIFTCPELPPVIEVQRMVYIPDNVVEEPCSITSGSPIITGIANISLLERGDAVLGTGIPVGAHIIDVSPDVIMNANATATNAAATLRFQRTKLQASQTTGVVPFFVELSIQFYEDMPEE
jgi:hypothetical protein